MVAKTILPNNDFKQDFASKYRNAKLFFKSIKAFDYYPGHTLTHKHFFWNPQEDIPCLAC